MALRLVDVEPKPYSFCITPTGRELPEMIDHWARLECLLGSKLIRVPGPSLLDRIKAYKTLPNFRLRYCTREVKIEPFIAYARSMVPAVCYLWRDHKDRWQEIEALEHWTGHTLRSEQRDSWPAGLADLRKKFEEGYVPKGAAQTDMNLEVAERPTMCAWCAR